MPINEAFKLTLPQGSSYKDYVAIKDFLQRDCIECDIHGKRGRNEVIQGVPYSEPSIPEYLIALEVSRAKLDESLRAAASKGIIKSYKVEAAYAVDVNSPTI